MTRPGLPLPAWWPALTRFRYGLGPRPGTPRRGAVPKWCFAEWEACDRWLAFKAKGGARPADVWRKVPSWESVGEEFSPFRLRGELLKKHPLPPAPQPFPDLLAVDPGPCRGLGAYVAEGMRYDYVRNALYKQGQGLEWLAIIPYYLDSQAIRELRSAMPDIRLLVWGSWWCNKDLRQSKYGLPPLLDEINRVGARGYVGECEQPAGRGDQTQVDFENIPAQLDTTAKLMEMGTYSALISDHMELVRDSTGHTPRGRHIHIECYADAAGLGFLPRNQLWLTARLVDPKHPVSFTPVMGFFGKNRDWANGAYDLEMKQTPRFQSWAGWRADGSMLPSDYQLVQSWR